MQILFINNDGGGFADHLEIAADTTVGRLFSERIKGRPQDYMIRGVPAPRSAPSPSRADDPLIYAPAPCGGTTTRIIIPSAQEVP
jgi:hypothetical protein